MKIEGFRSLNKDIVTIINKSESVKKAKKENDGNQNKTKKEISDEEKEYKSLRKKIQEKLIKFATRIPIFMYLTDYREHTLQDVITKLEPALFKKVTGLDVSDFNLLCTIGVFNASLMNDAIYKFKRYEDSSLAYTGINRHDEQLIGGWDTQIRKEEYEKLYYNQQDTLTDNTAPIVQDVFINKTSETIILKEKEIKKDEELEEMIVNIGSRVIHNKFGDGTVVAIDLQKDYIYVLFDNLGQKMFNKSFSFEKGYLKLK